MTNATQTRGEEILAAAAALRRRTDDELAGPLAAWLETEAESWSLRGNSGEGHTFHALSIARMVNGGGAS